MFELIIDIVLFLFKESSVSEGTSHIDVSFNSIREVFLEIAAIKCFKISLEFSYIAKLFKF